MHVYQGVHGRGVRSIRQPCERALEWLTMVVSEAGPQEPRHLRVVRLDADVCRRRRRQHL
jgi:hypothetical protein